SGNRHVADVAPVGVVAPGALHRVAAVAHAHVGRLALAAADPGALVSVLLAAGGGPATGRVLVGDGLGVLVALDDGEAIQGAGRTRVHEVLAAAGADVEQVGQVGQCDVAIGRADTEVTVSVVPGAETIGLVVVRVGALGREDDVLRVAVQRAGGVAEVAGGADRLGSHLRFAGRRRCGYRVVVPDAGQRAAAGRV